MNRDHLQYSLFVLPLCGLALSIVNVWNPYSYWFDELCSVAISQFDLRTTFHLILTDIHPPLYYLTLWSWVRLFGDSEFATRGLSLIFCSSALIYLALWGKSLPFVARVGTLVFFATSWLYPYYAQETRSYALLLLFSTLLTTLFLDYQKSDKRFYGLLVVCALSSLTHYFGLLLSSVVMVWLSLTHLKKPSRFFLIVGIGLSLLVWPVIHYLYGAIGPASGGNFYIKIEGPLATLQTFLDALIRIPMIVRHPVITIFVGLCLALLSCFLNNPQIKAACKQHQSELLRLAFLCIATVGLAAVIDLHTPVSTQRNYIILLPAVSIFVGLAANAFAQHARLHVVAVVLIILWGGQGLYRSYGSMEEKWEPLQNWKDSARYLIDHTQQGFSYYYLSPYGYSADFQDAVFNFYVSRYSRRAIVVHEVRIEDLKDTRAPFEILFGQAPADAFGAASPGLEGHTTPSVFYPTQSIAKSTGVILVDR